MDILSNPWVVGIGGGVLSGTLVTFVSRFLLSRRDRSEYTQKLVSANHELVYAIRPGISEGIIPAVDVVRALVSATARKYGVDSRDMFGPRETVQELIKEVMDSSFISAKAKEEYCNRLAMLEKPSPMGEDTRDTPLDQTTPRGTNLADYRARMVTVMSAMMGILAATMTAYVAFLEKGPGSSLRFASERFSWLLPALLSLLVVAAASAAMMVQREFSKRHQQVSRPTEQPRQGAASKKPTENGPV